MSAPLFRTSRQKILDAYAAAKQDFYAATTPYHSTQALRFTVVDVDLADEVAYAVARAGQTLRFFDYGLGGNVDLGATVAERATEAETNLTKAASTNGASDFVIEGVGLSCRGMRVRYPVVPAATVADPDVIACLGGGGLIADPAAVATPPQMQSPFNLEQAMFSAIQPLMSLHFELDRRRTMKLGLADLLPQAGAASYLKANGVPASDNRFQIPEGVLWRRDGQPDSEFIVELRLEKPVVVPINLATWHDGAATVLVPDRISLELVLRVFGLQIDLPSEN